MTVAAVDAVEDVPQFDHCPDCGYSLKGLPEPRCPECGLLVTAEAVASATLPWTRRRTPISFVRTVFQALIRPIKVRAMLDIDPDEKAARRFGFWCVVLAALGWAAVGTVIGWDAELREDLANGRGGDGWIRQDLVEPWSVGIYQFGVLPTALVVGMIISTSAVRGPFRLRHDDRRRARDVLSHYALASLPVVVLGLLPLAAVFATQYYNEGPEVWGAWGPAVYATVGILPLVVYLATWWCVRRLVLRLESGTWALGAMWPMIAIWPASMATGIVLVPWLVGMALIAWASLG